MEAHDAALLTPCPCGRRVILVGVGYVRRNLRARAELRALQLAQEVPQAIILQERLVALGDRSVTLGTRHCDWRADLSELSELVERSIVENVTELRACPQLSKIMLATR
jgi:hypothetical protein